MALAERAGLSELIEEKVSLGGTRVRSAGVNPAGKLTTIVAGMAADADCIDDVDVVRAGGMGRMFGGVYAPATLGQFLREFTHGHTCQLASVAREHLVGLVADSELLPGIAEQAFIDIDLLLRPVYGQSKQGASFGHTKIAGRQVLRKGLSPLATTISTEHGAPVVAGIRLRAGRAGSGRSAASMVREAIGTARRAGARGQILVRGDAAYGSAAVVTACVTAGARFSVVLPKHPAVSRAIAGIRDDAWTPVRYPGAVLDPDTGELISDAEVAEVTFTAFASTATPVTARLVVRRVRDRNHQDPLFPVWRHHPFFTDSTDDTAAAHHPPRACDHRDRLRRPDRRAAGPPAVRLVLRQRRLDALRRDHAQPAARRRHPDQPAARPRPRRHVPPADHHRPRPAHPPPAPSRATPARPLAVAPTVDRAVAAPVPHPATPTRLTPRPPPTRAPPGTRTSWPAQRITHAHTPTTRSGNGRRSSSRRVHGSRLRCHRVAGWICSARSPRGPARGARRTPGSSGSADDDRHRPGA